MEYSAMNQILEHHKTSQTPYIYFNGHTGVFNIEGSSSIANDQAFLDFYVPIVQLLEKYTQSPQVSSMFCFDIDYLDERSTSFFYDIFAQIDALRNHTDLSIIWYFDNDEQGELGSEYAEYFEDLPIKFIQKSAQLYYAFNSSEEHFSTLTIHGVQGNIHLTDAIWLSVQTTDKTQVGAPVVVTHSSSELKSQLQGIIDLCNMDSTQVQHVEVQYGNQMINALVTDWSQDTSPALATNHLQSIITQPQEQIADSENLVPPYKNYGRTEVSYKHYPQEGKLALTGYFYHHQQKRSLPVTLLFDGVKSLEYNPAHTVNTEYGSEIIYLREVNQEKTYTCFSALRDPIEIVANQVSLIENAVFV